MAALGSSEGGDQTAGLSQGFARRDGCLGLFRRWGPNDRAGSRVWEEGRLPWALQKVGTEWQGWIKGLGGGTVALGSLEGGA